MRYRTLGTEKTQREVSVLCLGAMLLGTVTDEVTSMAILDWYVEAGGTFIDTAEPELTLVAYSPLLGGAYVRKDKPLGAEFHHAGTTARLAALREVAAEAGATVNQVVPAWLIGGVIPMIPLVGASSVAQLEESLAAVELELTTEQRARLDAAR
jgi:aryl-alcohol dehydrogenase-like predicted oxidoreductase